MGIVPEVFKTKTPGEIVSTPVKAVVNTSIIQAPILGQNISDEFVKRADEFNEYTKRSFPVKTMVNSFSSAASAFKKFVKSI